jgi:hypothetical protein
MLRDCGRQRAAKQGGSIDDGERFAAKLFTEAVADGFFGGRILFAPESVDLEGPSPPPGECRRAKWKWLAVEDWEIASVGGGDGLPPIEFLSRCWIRARESEAWRRGHGFALANHLPPAPAAIAHHEPWRVEPAEAQSKWILRPAVRAEAERRWDGKSRASLARIFEAMAAPERKWTEPSLSAAMKASGQFPAPGKLRSKTPPPPEDYSS